MNAAELDTLPVGAVVLDHNDIAIQQTSPGYWASASFAQHEWPSRFLVTIEPFTVIHIPERTKP